MALVDSKPYAMVFELLGPYFSMSRWSDLPHGSVVDPKLLYSDPDPTLTLISDPDSDSNPDPACL